METSSEISLLVDIYKVFINTFDVILILDPANGNNVFLDALASLRSILFTDELTHNFRLLMFY